MNAMKVKAAAKINLALDVTGKLPNGYHTIESVFQTVSIYDEITIEMTDSNTEIILTCEVPEHLSKSNDIPCDERNIAYKAAKLFLEENKYNLGCRIHIKKGIPSQAGMGGGSTDAAAVLYCLNKLTGKKISAPEKLGADVPFFLTGGTAYVSGIGEKITPIESYAGRILVIAKGTEGVSTMEAYQNIDTLEKPVHPQVDKLVQAIETKKSDAYNYFGNLFEEAVSLTEVKNIKSAMLMWGALSAVMTGSGSAVFGMFNDEDKAVKCAEKLKTEGYFAQVCLTIDDSFTEI